MIADKLIILNQTTLDSLKENEERQIVKKFSKVAIKILAADFGFVWLKKRNSKRLELAFKSPSTPFTPTIPRKSGTTYSVLNRKTPLLINKISKTNSVRAFAKKYLEGLAIIPITYKSHTYGNMYICFKSERKFSQEDLALCGSIGNSTAQAITINRLHQSLHNIKHTLDHTPEPVLIFEPASQRISYFNKSLLDQTGLKKTQLNQMRFKNIIHPSFHKIFERRLKHIMEKRVPSSMFEVTLNSEENKIPVEMSLQYVNLPNQAPHLLAIFRDLRERKKSEDQIKKAAFHDTLTGLPNRFLFTRKLSSFLLNAEQKKRQFAVMFVDLDRFKYINDTVGHLAGDELLRQAAQRLKKNVKRRDVVSRFGGDEFVILLGNIRSPKQPNRVAERIRKAFENPFKLLREREIYINLSIGISTFPKDGNDSASLLKSADSALYRAKQHGGNGYQHYHTTMAVIATPHFEIEKDLRKAIINNQLLLNYQPIIELKSGRVLGVEALLRWQHPKLGLLLPTAFVPYAEDSGLIDKLGHWVFRESLRQQKAWRGDELNINISINLSGRELLQKNMIRKMQRLLRLFRLSAKNITLELTETFLIKNMETSIHILKNLRKLGFKTSLDGFGSGYASLDYLKRLPVDYIKIDQPLIEGSLTSRKDIRIIEAIITLAHHLNIKVVAEGVEKNQQINFLRQLGCDMVQGNYYSPAVAAEKVLDVFKKPHYNKIR